MVLQRGRLNTLWGWSVPGDKLKIEIGGANSSGISGPDGRWQVKIQPPPVGGPYTVKISGHETVELHNVMVGDVWLCGGQSNMGLPLRFTRNGEAEAKQAN
jgi:sialate O-acetylesterase